MGWGGFIGKATNIATDIAVAIATNIAIAIVTNIAIIYIPNGAPSPLDKYFFIYCFIFISIFSNKWDNDSCPKYSYSYQLGLYSGT